MTKHDMTSADWMALLDFYIEAGVDCALDEVAHNRFQESTVVKKVVVSEAKQVSSSSQFPPPVLASSSGTRSLPKLAAGAPEKAAEDARMKAQSARSLEELHAFLAAFDGCGLKFSARNLVFADGNPQARVMMVGEAPGADEDLQGKPFVGRSGMLLDRMLAAIGLDRTSAYISNIIPWRPPGNRTPTPQEIAVCKPFIMRHIELAAPKILVTLGGPATQTLLGVKEGILKTRGRWYSYEGEKISITALAMLHPAYLLRQPLQKRFAWRDLLSLQQALKAE